jgi:hypothetical protein
MSQFAVVPRSTPVAIKRACVRVSWAAACMVALRGSWAYPRPMRSGVAAAIDSRLEELAVTWVRRQLPALRLVPAGWIRPVIKPTVVRLRRSLSWGAIGLVVPVGTVLTLLILMP